MSYLEVKKAKVHLKRTMLLLLQKKGLQQIKIKELTEQAHVSRKVMLQFYPDKYAIFDELVKEMKKSLSEVLAKAAMLDAVDISLKQKATLEAVFVFLQKNRVFFQILMDRKMDPYIDFYDFFLDCQQCFCDQKKAKHDRAVLFYMMSLYVVKENVTFSSDDICEKFHKYHTSLCDRVNCICIKIADEPRITTPLERQLQYAFIELLLEKTAYEKITISDIMQKSRLRRATFYECYRSKEELFSSVLQEACCQLIKLYSIENLVDYCERDAETAFCKQKNGYANAETNIFPLYENICPLPNLLATMVDQLISLYIAQKRRFDRDNILDAYIFSGKIVAFFLEKLQLKPNVVHN